MAEDRLQRRADALAARVEALAAALRASGVSDDTAERLLSRASAAVLQALTLELLLEQPESAAAERRRPAAGFEPADGTGFQLAA